MTLEGGESCSQPKERSDPSLASCSEETWRASPLPLGHCLREPCLRAVVRSALPSPPLDLGRLLTEMPVAGSLSLWRFLEASRASSSSQLSTTVLLVVSSAVSSSSEEPTYTRAGGENFLCSEEWDTSRGE